MKRITFLADINNFTGYGQHLIETVIRMERLGYYPSIRAKSTNHVIRIPDNVVSKVVQDVQPEPIEILLSHPTELPTPGKKTIYFTMWESTKLPVRNVQFLNLSEAVVVPSHWNRTMFLNSGVKVPIYVVPLGIDEKIFNFRVKEPTGECVFGTAGRYANGQIRKGVQEVIYCFQEAFRGRSGVKLRVKVHPDDPVWIPEEDHRIEVVRDHLSPTQLVEWLASLNFFVSAAKAEAWGFWQQQSMAVGRPVIGAIYAGLQMFMDELNSLGVDFDEVPTLDNYLGGGNWAQPSLMDMVNKMRIWSNVKVGIANSIGRSASKSASRFTWDRSVDELINVIQKVESGEHSVEKIVMTDTHLKIEQINYPPTVVQQCIDKGFDYQVVEFPVSDGRMRFNPSIIEVDGVNWITVRSAFMDREGNRVNSRIERWRFTEYLKPTNDWTVMNLGVENLQYEDPRLFKYNSVCDPFVGGGAGIAMSYTIYGGGGVATPATQAIAFMDNDFKVQRCWTPELKENKRKMEKNWIWFVDHSGHLKFIYTMDPMVIVEPDKSLNSNRVEAEYRTNTQLEWKYGQVRGSTPPIEVDQGMLAFFHSALPWKQERRHYVIGAVLFDPAPPHKVFRISSDPILQGHPNDPNLLIHHACVFPGGFLKRGDKFVVTLGVNDDFSMIVTLPENMVINNMVDV